MGNFYLIVIDGLGVGAQEDARSYGDEGANTLAHVSEKTGVSLPNLGKLGLGNIIPLASVPAEPGHTAAYGKMREVSGGKDSTTGHWEIAGIRLARPFPSFPEGFPEEVTAAFIQGTGTAGILCNRPYSGTDVIRDYGEEHLKTGKPIVYTSADSVFQVACHTGVVPVEKLYAWCEFARNHVLTGSYEVGRVIARPFKGEPGNFERISEQRHDFSAIPPEKNVVQLLQDAGINTYSIGKVIDLFAGKGFNGFYRTKNNAEGIAHLISVMDKLSHSFVFVNLIDTDQLFGHRLDPEGYAGSLKEFDDALPELLARVKEEDILIITSDHGNDPCMASTDHSREFVPLLVYPAEKAERPVLGTRSTFSDVANTAARFFQKEAVFPGKSFLKE